MEASPLHTLVSIPLDLLFLTVLDCAGVSPRTVPKVDLLHSGVPQSKAPRSPSTNVCLHVLDCTSQVKFKGVQGGEAFPERHGEAQLCLPCLLHLPNLHVPPSVGTSTPSFPQTTSTELLFLSCFPSSWKVLDLGNVLR